MTLGSRAMRDVHEAALKVVAAFKDRPEREHLHEVQLECLDELGAACRFLHELMTAEAERP